MKKFICYLLLLTLLPSIGSSQNVDELITLKFQQTTIENNEYFVIHLNLKKDWHVYWKNPGDSGIATNWTFTLKNNSIALDMLEWPAPKLHKEAGNLWTFGYNDENTFFANIKKNNNKKDELILVAEFLVCKELCIPAKFTFNFDVLNGKISVPAELTLSLNEKDLNEKLLSLPQIVKMPENWSYRLYHLENSTQLRLIFNFPETDEAPIDDHLLTPFLAQPLNFRHFDFASGQFTMDIDWDGQYIEPKEPLPTDGNFAKKYFLKFLWHQSGNKNSVLNLSIDQFTTLSQTEWDNLKKNQQNSEKTIQDNLTSNQNSKTSFILMLFFALLGGFILNFMPCVLPVISLKLYSLIQHKQKLRSDLIKHHGSYTLGVLLSFWVFALIIVLLKQSGEAIGWGFQLQSPTFVWIMILVFSILSFNLFGLFEFKTPGGKLISNFRSDHPYIDDFMAGLLAVIVATPCSAPFLGPALTYAFSENALIIFSMFTSMALGLSLPFILTALMPSSLKFLPRPGAWMNTFKYIMGLALLISCLWLFEVLQYLGNFSTISFMLYFVLILLFFTFFIYQKEKKLTPLVILMIALSIFHVGRSFYMLQHQFTNLSEDNINLKWQIWNEEKIDELLASQNTFFIDATAQWCITCQVNKKLVLESEDFSTFIAENHITTLRLDWTKKDAKMFTWMQKHGAVSVPAYFLGIKGKVFFLGETISIQKIKNALQNN